MYLAPAFERFVQKKEAFLDSFIDLGSEQELFAASYIHGHLSIVAASVFTIDDSDLSPKQLESLYATFHQVLSTSIDKAIADKELQGDDAEDVKSMLSRLAVI